MNEPVDKTICTPKSGGVSAGFNNDPYLREARKELALTKAADLCIHNEIQASEINHYARIFLEFLDSE